MIATTKLGKKMDPATIYTSSRAVITDDAKRIALIKERIAALLSQSK